MKTLVEFAAEYISNQADRGYLTEASQKMQSMVDSINRNGGVHGHSLEYTGEKIHIIHPNGKSVVGSFKPYAGIGIEDIKYHVRGHLPRYKRGRGEVPGSEIQQFPRGMKV